MRTFLRAVPAALAAFALAFATRIAISAKKETLRQWLDGPVHYIIQPSEIKEFKSLKTDAERVAFIERFWRRRDPSPSTLVNEYRQMFWKRVQEANEKFLDSAGPGWQTDRGKIYILYGPPEEVREDPNAKATDSQTDVTGLIRWTYTKPGGRRDIDPVVFVPFVRDVSGEYKLSYDPKLSSPFFDWQQVEDNRTIGLGSYLTSAQHAGDPLTVLLDLGKMQEVPPQEKILLDEVETVETFAFQPLALTIDRYQPDGKGLLAVVTVAVPGPAGSEPPAILARFIKRGATSSTQVLGEGSFRVDGEGDDRVAQGRAALDAGAWDLTVLAVEQDTGVSRIYRGRVDPFPGGSDLRLSDVVVARVMEPLPYAAQAAYDAPYIVGGFRVVPRAERQVKRGDPVQVFFEVYGGNAPYHLAYQLEGQEKDSRWRALGRPQESDATQHGQGFALPTSKAWPIGAYRIQIAVSDALGAKSTATSPFSLVPDSTP